MGPFANPGFAPAKVNARLAQPQIQTPATQASNNEIFLGTANCTEDMPPPPAYDMVVDVDPNAPISNFANPYDPVSDDEKEDDEDEEEEIPEVKINASTQIRGHGNIIQVAHMDGPRIAGMLHCMLFGQPPNSPPLQSPTNTTAPGLQMSSNGRAPSSYVPRAAMNTGPSTQKLKVRFPKINITVECGATVIGDKNIIGPGLGEIARHMQVAQNRQMAQAHAVAQAQAAAAARQRAMSGDGTGREPIHILTPPRSRQNSEDAVAGGGGMKRKASVEDEGERSPEVKRVRV